MSLKKDKPCTPVLLELMELTFCHRHEFVLNFAILVDEILMTYPALRQSDVVSTLIISKVCPYINMLIVHMKKMRGIYGLSHKLATFHTY